METFKKIALAFLVVTLIFILSGAPFLATAIVFLVALAFLMLSYLEGEWTTDSSDTKVRNYSNRLR